MYMYAYYAFFVCGGGYVYVCSSCSTLIGVHEIHDRIPPNYMYM
jgi:hypothetical protein